MKKIISVLSCLAMVCSATAAMAAPTVVFDGETMTFDVEPYISEDRTMVPMRAIFEKAGATVIWDGDTQTVIAVKGNDNATCVTLQIGNVSAFVNSNLITLDKPAEIVNDRTMVPLRFVMESLGADVTWDEATQTVNIKTADDTQTEQPADAADTSDQTTDAADAADKTSDDADTSEGSAQ